MHNLKISFALDTLTEGDISDQVKKFLEDILPGALVREFGSHAPDVFCIHPHVSID